MRAIGGRVGGSFPAALKPSRITAYTGVTAGTLELVFTNLPDGDSWLSRALYMAQEAKDGWPHGLHDGVIGTDGSHVGSVLAAQLKQNALPAIGTMAGFGIVAAIERYFGM